MSRHLQTIDNNKKNILIICPDANSFARYYVKNVLLQREYNICVLSVTLTKKEFIDWMIEQGVYYCSLKSDKSGIASWKPVSIVSAISNVKRTFKRIDAIHVHYISLPTLLPTLFFKKKALFLTFWGSDIFYIHNLELMLEKYYFRRAKSIQCMSGPMLEKFNRKTNGRYKEKAIELDYGTELLSSIIENEKKTDRRNAKKSFDIEDDKICVHVGYNGRRMQHHMDMVKALANVVGKEKVLVVFHWSYGGDDKYMNELEDCIRKLEISYKFITDYMIGERLAAFRRTCDVFFYGQDTDGISCSVLEYLYAGAICVKGDWLDYSSLTLQGLEIIEFSQFNEIAEIMRKILAGEISIDIEKQRKVIDSMKSWKVLAPKWIAVYED